MTDGRTRQLDLVRRLKAGNARYVEGASRSDVVTNQHRRDQLIDGQSPLAVILSCSDSRVPSELVFDLGLGDLFVVRVAGNVVAPSIVGSVEFAVSAFDTELVVVMGHTRCGAIRATINALQGARALTDNVHDIVDRISPSIAEIVRHLEPETALRAATRANVRASASHLRHGSRMLEKRVEEGRLLIVEAEYALETGFVDFFGLGDDLPA